MIQFLSIASGSSGNCYYLSCDGQSILIDCGIGIRLLKRTFSNYGLTFARLAGILVTHDHVDHTKAVGAVSQAFRLPVYTTEPVFGVIRDNYVITKKVPEGLRHVIRPYEPFTIGPFEITPFHVPHDSADNNGYIIRAHDLTFVLMTDIGTFTAEMESIVHSATHLVIEANYDPEMLAQGPYPARLKGRITGPRGHISNDETGDFLAAHLDRDRIRRVWLCHLSAENNRPDIALKTVTARLTAGGYDLEAPDALKLEALARKTPGLLTDLL